MADNDKDIEAECAAKNAKSNFKGKQFELAKFHIKKALELKPHLELGFEMLVIIETVYYGRETQAWEKRKKYGNPFAYSGIDWYSILHLDSTASEAQVKSRCKNLLSCLNWSKKRFDGVSFPMAHVANHLIEEAEVILCDQQKRLLFDQTRRELWALVDSPKNSSHVVDSKQAYMDWKPPIFMNTNTINPQPVKKTKEDILSISNVEVPISSSPVSECFRVGEETSIETLVNNKKQIFDAMPQAPHYQPLDKYVGLVREGIVYGLEMAFVNLSEEIRGLDPQSLCSGLKSFKVQLNQLEEMGFSVTKLRERLDKLQEIAKSEGPSEVTMEEFEAEIASEEAKVSQKQSRILELEGEYEKCKAVINNKRCKIEELQSDSVKIVEEFKSLAKSAWK